MSFIDTRATGVGTSSETLVVPSRVPAGQRCFDWFDPEEREKRFIATSDGRNVVIAGRELEVFRLLGEGLSAKQAGSKMGISAKTVDNHRQSVMRKLGLCSRAELVLQAVRSGVVAV